MNLIYAGIFVVGMAGAALSFGAMRATRRTSQMIALLREPMGLAGYYVVADLHVGCSIADPMSKMTCDAHQTRPVVLRVHSVAAHGVDLFDPAPYGSAPFRQSS